MIWTRMKSLADQSCEEMGTQVSPGNYAVLDSNQDNEAPD
jgi:hypothetical protein